MYKNGQSIQSDAELQDHLMAAVPVQLYRNEVHADIGFIDSYCEYFVKINNTYYQRNMITLISRAGY